MYISEKVKESLRPFEGHAVLIDAQEVHQYFNPGDGLISKFKMLGPANEPSASPPGLATLGVEGLALQVSTDFEATPQKLIIEVLNAGAVARQVDLGTLAPTILMKVRDGVFVWGNASDGPSTALITRMDVNFLAKAPWVSSMGVAGHPIVTVLSLASGAPLTRMFTLSGGERLEVRLSFGLSQGEYEFMAGYGGGVHAARGLASNLVPFNVDASGTAREVR